MTSSSPSSSSSSSSSKSKSITISINSNTSNETNNNKINQTSSDSISTNPPSILNESLKSHPSSQNLISSSISSTSTISNNTNNAITPPSSPPPLTHSNFSSHNHLIQSNQNESSSSPILTLNISNTNKTKFISTNNFSASSNLSNFPSIHPNRLFHLIKFLPHSILILDIRSLSSFKLCHLSQSVGLNLPTTLLKRPLYTLDKIQESLETLQDRSSFARFKTSLPNSLLPSDSNERLKHIVVLDHDSRLVTPTHSLSLVLKKFESVGFLGQLLWLCGGFEGLLSERGHDPELLSILESSNETQTNNHLSSKDNQTKSLRMSLSMPPALTDSPPKSNLCLSSSHHRQSSEVSWRTVEKSSNGLGSGHSEQPAMTFNLLTSSHLPSTPAAFQSPNFTLKPDQMRKYSLNFKSKNPLNPPNRFSLPSRPSSGLVNPFFDNIRQLNERLSLKGSLDNLSPVQLPTLSNPSQDLTRLPPFLRRLLQDPPHARAQRLAHEFHDLEMAEQRRLQDVMQWETSRGTSLSHSSSFQLLTTPSNKTFNAHTLSHQGGILEGVAQHPFSISAGVELGYKNRYKNIWPYEHARIRLGEGPTQRNGTDYVNASMISFRSDGAPSELEKLGVGKRRYIATQGPLASTFEDFWSVVGQEDVGLIVMITRRHEAGREKCGNYVKNGVYGEMIVCVESDEIVESDDEEREKTGDFFGFGGSKLSNGSDAKPSTYSSLNKSNSAFLTGVVHKTVKLSRASYPNLPPRKIAHIQYRLWPDFDVPPAINEVLELIEHCQKAAKQITEINQRAIKEYCEQTAESQEKIKELVGIGSGPQVVHCSAGVGRTGSFIVLDLMTEVLRAQYCAKNHSEEMTGASHQAASKLERSNHHINYFGCDPADVEKNVDCNQKQKDETLPRFLESELCDNQARVAPIWQLNPVMAVVNEMREQRMSMVANYRQYVFVHEALLSFMLKELKIMTSSELKAGDGTFTSSRSLREAQTSNRLNLAINEQNTQA
ncbi:hypothetical protein O181_019037 [Austropuccinia psidii MF-1]|uniref:Protein-tyrosine-phosphatase n=1 Tax=Austropuccinia psidii MF-1 TaxID=1389203 RepID=A0A9Q3GU17_9BASI|nr:hypothetical protein [Austropuccinia psidii MF-1]